MRDSFRPSGYASEPLLVDIETGMLLEAPPSPVVSRRYCDSHPFVAVARRGDAEHVFAGPDAAFGAAGYSGNDNYVEYSVERDVAGFLHLKQVLS